MIFMKKANGDGEKWQDFSQMGQRQPKGDERSCQWGRSKLTAINGLMYLIIFL